MNAKNISRFDLRGLVHQQIQEGVQVDKALDTALHEAAHHAVSVLDQTGDISVAIGSIGIESPDEIESAIRRIIGERIPRDKEFLASILRVVGRGGITGMPTANCLYQYLPHDRKPTRQEMEEAWAKCSQRAAAAI